MVLRRIATVPPFAPPRPMPAPPSGPQLLGFAEPVKNVPPVEAFVVELGEAAAPAPDRQAEFVALQAVAPPRPAPLPEPVPEPTPPRPPARGLPSERAAPAPPPPTNRAQNLVGRLGRGLDEASRVAPSQQPAADRTDRPSSRQNRRLHRRAKLAAEIEIGGVPCTLIDVSVGGFAATGVPQIEPNALVPVMIRLMIDGIEVGTELSARIVYVTQGRSAGRFIDLSPSQMAFLRYIVTWRGESVGAVGTTTLLDAIARGPERGFPRGPSHRSGASTKPRWWEGLIGRKNSPPW